MKNFLRGPCLQLRMYHRYSEAPLAVVRIVQNLGQITPITLRKRSWPTQGLTWKDNILLCNRYLKLNYITYVIVFLWVIDVWLNNGRNILTSNDTRVYLLWTHQTVMMINLILFCNAIENNFFSDWLFLRSIWMQIIISTVFKFFIWSIQFNFLTTLNFLTSKLENFKKRRLDEKILRIIFSGIPLNENGFLSFATAIWSIYKSE